MLFHIDSFGTVRPCPVPLGVCDLAPHFETFTAAQGLCVRVMTGHDEDESMFRQF